MSQPYEPGSVLAGKYRVERILGQGGMGIVVAALHLSLDELVAIKFLLPEALHNPQVVGRFEREAKAAAKIRSEHVARVRDVGKLDWGTPYMVMEYLEGRDLGQILRQRGCFPLQEAVDYLLQACEALAEAHALGIVHRDLKPSNLFLTARADGSACIKVLDFGISKVLGAGSGNYAEMGMTRSTMVLGSPLYMSPEQLSSSRDVDTRTDIWSLGVILFELLTGRPPFAAQSLPQLCMTIMTQGAPNMRETRPDLPIGVEQIVAQCLQREPKQRIQSVAVLAQMLTQFAPKRSMLSVERIARVAQSSGMTALGSNDAVVERPFGLDGTLAEFGRTTRDRRTSQRNRMLAGVSLLALGAVGGGYVWFNRGLARLESHVSGASSAPALETHANSGRVVLTAPVPTAAPPAAAAPAPTASAPPVEAVSSTPAPLPPPAASVEGPRASGAAKRVSESSPAKPKTDKGAAPTGSSKAPNNNSPWGGRL
ncbi:MAG TPA: serine/threonine-protein kinase [Polyangiaceae bacterium]|nr:serine/threonine-protein kinase [Polyangiaceae bacterium]